MASSGSEKRRACSYRTLDAPLACYRIADPRFPVMDGAGAALVGGRWNAIGQPVVYASLSFGGALIEQLVHAGVGRLPPRVHVRITIPAGVRVAAPAPGALAGWDSDDFVAARRIGRVWLHDRAAVALVVPSKSAAPFERNVVINPLHRDYRRLVVTPPAALDWDPRLKRRTPP